MSIAITGTGSYIPTLTITNKDFNKHEFLNLDGSTFKHTNEVIIEKFKAITGIEERRYASKEFTTSNLAFFAAEKAIESAQIDKETLDYIIVAHNFGDLVHGQTQGDTLPSLATRVKHQLQIKNPKCVAYDLIFGCPGWLEGMIQANAFIKSGIANKCLVIGAETLSRVVDDYDRDSMIYSDGAGAAIVERTNKGGEIIAHESGTYAMDEANYLFFGNTYNKNEEDNTYYIKMFGRKIYEFAVTHVPKAMASCLDKSGIEIDEVKKIFIHQANEKMDEAIVKRFYKLYGKEMPEGIMPMSIAKLGNSSVATIPTLFDLIKQGKLENQEVKKGDVVIFASVGAGMNVNAMIYRI
ncbi:3-oxoacyl-[acyl-carrier-protein] synthase-3 [Maribacter orientalis]|uniref:3-oxoacyl-[acyl-carrier-protein] synthase-3 n=1 Tax=Maribacter orientalis TaxID=228957 RepID=A0A1H7QP01_9FLAO|nr:ketoacyl-ACP synthase III [Maribacter orientalis]SEL49652.1 3-oxoacyl-[acyl-carrier-protein] synthase-3 [Maribacter orientalis]|tara:strand:+ start:196 stop:1254 length:1059 start_codon:yes stop_codon:yes gene_type:complete